MESEIALDLGLILRESLKGSGGNGRCEDCRLFSAPDTVVQPDLIVVCDSRKLANGKYVDGSRVCIPAWKKRWASFSAGRTMIPN